LEFDNILIIDFGFLIADISFGIVFYEKLNKRIKYECWVLCV